VRNQKTIGALVFGALAIVALIGHFSGRMNGRTSVSTVIVKDLTVVPKQTKKVEPVTIEAKSTPMQEVATDSARQTDPQVEKITQLSQIVINSPAKLKALRALLMDPQLAVKIATALNDPAAFDGDRFTDKLRLMDALYEGLKFPDKSVSRRYFELSRSLLSAEPPAEIASDRELSRQYLADRSEIALVILKNFPAMASTLRTQTGERGHLAFVKASRLTNTYEVAL
jgi:hypothetical protein